MFYRLRANDINGPGDEWRLELQKPIVSLTTRVAKIFAVGMH